MSRTSDEFMPTPEEFIPTRESLLSRLKDLGDQDSWQDFYNTYCRLIFSVALKSGLSRDEAKDVLQETFISVARKIEAFKYDPARGSFKRWLLNLTQWRIADQYRKRRRHAARQADEDDKTDLMKQVPDPASLETPARIWDEEWQNNLREVAMERVKKKVSPRDIQIFQLYAQRDWPVSKVAKTLGVSRTHIYVAKHRVVALLKKEINSLKQKLF
jgi:RNA polymerase sigma factor (sigma-70 family)